MFNLIWLFTVLPYLLWVLYLASMSVYRAHLLGTLPLKARVLSYPLLIIAWVVDWLSNWTWAIAFFGEVPQSPGELVTTRLARYLNPVGHEATQQTYRYRRAKLICENLLDGFDPNPKGHCV
jgi:hypothetical protein